MGRVVIPGFRKIETSGGGEVSGNYNDLANKPSINNVPLVGNLKTVDLKLTDSTLTEEGIPAEAKEVGLRLTAHSTSLTELSEQLGSHTVKSDVPENAVFTDTVYDDTEIKESLSKQSSEIMDIKMLGWSVPKECPIQNEVNENQFVQKVGRVDLGSLSWIYDSSIPRFYSGDLQNFIEKVKSESDIFSGYLKDYENLSLDNLFSSVKDKAIAESTNGTLSIVNLSYTDASAFKSEMQGKYLYYELAAPITTVIDGNEIGETVSDVRKETTVNFWNPTLQTTTINGITCTNNGDGTYTLSGQNDGTNQSYFKLTGSLVLNNDCVLTGCVGSDSGRFGLGVFDGTVTHEEVNDPIFLNAGTYPESYIFVRVGVGIPDNTIIKPMITTNLDATYDDFVPYTGNTGKLNSDVASLLKRIEALEALTTKTDTTKTDTSTTVTE